MFTATLQGTFQAKLLIDLAWLDHGFGTRRTEGWLDNEPVASLKQVHSATVLEAAHAAVLVGEGDALVSNRSGIWLAVRTADCVPVILADPVRRAVAVIHSGWRGTVARIVERTVESLASKYGTDPSDLTAAVGPAIGECCYEVGPEVAREFRMLLPERGDLDGRTRIDLAEAVARQLVLAGVARGRIAQSAACTRCAPHDFHSFRRDGGAAGRMVSAVRIR